MGKFCDVEKFKKAYRHKIGTQFDNAINEMERERFCVDVVERSKIDKAIEEITKLRDSTSRMITDEVDFVNECYEQYVNCFDECLRIIKRI